MTKRTFEKFINILIESGKKEKIIYDNGLDLMDFVDSYSSVNTILLNSIYGEDTSGLISDFITDSIYDELEKNKGNYIIYKLDKQTGNDIILADCSTLDGLYEYSESNRLDLIKTNYSYDIGDPMSDEDKMNYLQEIFKK